MQIGNQRSKPRSSLISTKRAQLLTSPFPLGCDHPTSLGLPMCWRVTPSPQPAPQRLWPPELALGRRVQPGFRLFACCFLQFSHAGVKFVLAERAEPPASSGGQRLEGGEGEEAGARVEQGGGGAVQGLCGDFGDKGGCWQVAPLPLLRDLAWFSPWLAAPGGSGQSLLAPGKSVLGSVVWGGAGSRVWVRDQGRAGCLGAKFPSWGYSCRPHVSLGRGLHKAPAPIAALPAPAWRWGQSAGWGASPCSLPRPFHLQRLHALPPRQPLESRPPCTTQESREAAEL